MDREAGYYWVKIEGEWEVMRLLGGYWESAGSDEFCTEQDLEDIGPKLSPPVDYTP